MLAAKSNSSIDPREKKLHHLKSFVRKVIERGREIVLMMDANVSPENRTMNNMIMECGLTDPHFMVDPYSETETYARGKAKIDYILTTTRIQQKHNLHPDNSIS